MNEKCVVIFGAGGPTFVSDPLSDLDAMELAAKLLGFSQLAGEYPRVVDADYGLRLKQLVKL